MDDAKLREELLALIKQKALIKETVLLLPGKKLLSILTENRSLLTPGNF
jgi:hypothetical protein